MVGLTRIKTDNILDREVREQDLADGAVTFDKIQIGSGGLAGEVLKTDGAGNLFFQAATGAAQNLDSLTDVDVTTNLPLIGDALAWDGAFWAPQSSIPGNPQNLTLTNLVDVTLTPLAQNEFLKFDGTKWVNDKVSVIHVESIQPVAVTGLIGDLANVNVAGATLDQRLGFDGSQWRAVDAAELSSIDAFADVDTTGKTDGDALVFDGGTLTWGAVDIGGLGASNRTTIVQDQTAMLAQSLKVGDQTYILDGSTVGEWELYLLLTLPGTVIGEWSRIATLDSAATDAGTLHAAGDIDVTTISPVLLGNVSQGSRVTLVSIDVSVAFDGSPVLTVGTDGSPTTNTELASDDEMDLSVVGTYTIVADFVYNNVPDTDIKAYFAVGGATVGNARVLVTYV